MVAGRAWPRSISKLNPLLRGWMSYFRLTRSEGGAGGLGRVASTQAALPAVAAVEAHVHPGQGADEARTDAQRAWLSATNGRGAWWNAGASHMNHAFPKSYFDRMGLVSLLDTCRRFQCVS